MKSKNYILSVLAIGLMMGSMVSCSDFLDTKPSTSVDDTDVFQTTSGAQSALNGCYYQMRAYGSGGANRGDDYGIPSIQMISDMCGEDVMNNGSGWDLYNYNYWGETQANIFRTDQLWTFHYRLVNNLNSVITYVDDSEGEDMDKQYIKGQALALRGWAYFDLARLYQQTYAIAKDMPGVPIYTEPTVDGTQGKPRGTLEETYQQILSDLTTAESMLEGFVRSSSYPNVFDQTVVQGVLSQVYQVMNNWAKSEEYAKKVLAVYPLTTAEEYANGFNDHLTKSWIWGIKQTEEQNMGDYLLLLCGTTVIVNVGLLQALSSLISLWICLTKMIFASNSSRIGLRVLARRKKNSGFLISSGIMRTAADRWLSCVPTKCC